MTPLKMVVRNTRTQVMDMMEPNIASTLKIFLNRERPNIAGTASIQIARGPVVQGMLPAPVPVRRQIPQGRDGADRVVGPFGFEKGGVATVVENDKDPREKACRKNRQRQHQPIGNCECVDHRDPQQHIRNKGVDQLPARAARQRLTNSQTLEITTDPSPTDEATRLTEPARTSPTAKMPGCDVAKGEAACLRRNR